MLSLSMIEKIPEPNTKDECIGRVDVILGALLATCVGTKCMHDTPFSKHSIS
jgi:hypothetical protein